MLIFYDELARNQNITFVQISRSLIRLQASILSNTHNLIANNTFWTEVARKK
jgi:SAM-dependent MidA family methyltransferase